jgi:hypothetical protein
VTDPTTSDRSIRWNLHGRLPRLCFIHLQKTGGISLESVLRSVYPTRAWFVAWKVGDLAGKGAADLANFDVCAGHCGGGLWRVCAPDAEGLTLLREPVARTLSHLRHLRRLATARGSEPGDEGRAALRSEDWHRVLDFQGSVVWDNFCCRMLGFPPAQFEEVLAKGGGVRDHTEAVFQSLLRGLDPAGAFDRARLLLPDLVLAGITERMADSIRLICDRLEIFPPPPPQLNRDPARGAGGPGDHGGQSSEVSAFPPDVIERVRDLCRLDLELYAEVCDRFDAAISRLDARPVRSIHPGRALVGAARSRLMLPLRHRVEKTAKHLVHTPGAAKIPGARTVLRAVLRAVRD